MVIQELKTLTDDELVDLILSTKNSKIFEEIYERYAAKVFNKCLSFTHDRSVAEDYTHDVLVKAFLKISTFRKGSKFSTWLYAITYNYCVDKQKQYQKERDMRNEFSEDYDDHENSDEDLFNIRIDRLKQVLNFLTPEERMILLLKYQDDLSIIQLKELFQINESAVKMRLKRSKQKLLEIYKEKYSHIDE